MMRIAKYSLQLFAFWLCTLPVTHAQQKGLGEGADTAKHLGVATCASTICHGSIRPLEARNVLQNEYVTWSTYDPHSRAYKVLFDEKSRKIAKSLGLKNAHEAPECLGCHTDYVPPEQRGPRFQLSDGIGCEACHGGAENYLTSHDDGPSVTHAANLANGLRAIEKPLVRATVCLDCHVGNATRFASHRMMAAGHPRLAFELDTYTELWRTAGGREHYRVDRDYVARKEQAEPVMVWLTGLTAASRRSVEMLGWHIGKGMGALPDFALYNCYSCHRAMELSGWSQGRDDGMPLGTIRLQDGHLRALLAVLDATDARQAATLRRALSALNSSVNGDGTNFRTALTNLRSALATVEQRVDESQWGRRELMGVLDALTKAARRGAFADYAAAEQAAMAMVLLLTELEMADANAPEVDALFRSLEDDSRFDSRRFAQVLNLLRTLKGDAPPAQR